MEHTATEQTNSFNAVKAQLEGKVFNLEKHVEELLNEKKTLSEKIEELENHIEKVHDEKRFDLSEITKYDWVLQIYYVNFADSFVTYNEIIYVSVVTDCTLKKSMYSCVIPHFSLTPVAFLLFILRLEKIRVQLGDYFILRCATLFSRKAEKFIKAASQHKARIQAVAHAATTVEVAPVSESSSKCYSLVCVCVFFFFCRTNTSQSYPLIIERTVDIYKICISAYILYYLFGSTY